MIETENKMVQYKNYYNLANARTFDEKMNKMHIIHRARKIIWKITITIGISRAEHCCLVKSAAAFNIAIAMISKVITSRYFSATATHHKKDNHKESPTNNSDSSLIFNIFEILWEIIIMEQILQKGNIIDKECCCSNT